MVLSSHTMDLSSILFASFVDMWWAQNVLKSSFLRVVGEILALIAALSCLRWTTTTFHQQWDLLRDQGSCWDPHSVGEIQWDFDMWSTYPY